MLPSRRTTPHVFLSVWKRHSKLYRATVSAATGDGRGKQHQELGRTVLIDLVHRSVFDQETSNIVQEFPKTILCSITLIVPKSSTLNKFIVLF